MMLQSPPPSPPPSPCPSSSLDVTAPSPFRSRFRFNGTRLADNRDSVNPTMANTATSVTASIQTVDPLGSTSRLHACKPGKG